MTTPSIFVAMWLFVATTAADSSTTENLTFRVTRYEVLKNLPPDELRAYLSTFNAGKHAYGAELQTLFEIERKCRSLRDSGLGKDHPSVRSVESERNEQTRIVAELEKRMLKGFEIDAGIADKALTRIRPK